MTYTELKQAILDWPDLEGEDTLESYLDTIVDLAEAEINSRLRVDRMLNYQYADGSDGLIQLSSGFRELSYVRDPDGYPCEPRPPQDIDAEANEDCSTSTRVMYIVDGLQLRLNRAVEGTFTIRFYEALPALSSANENTWLLTEAPDLYLYAALMHAGVFSKGPDVDQTRYEKLYLAALSRVSAEHAARRYPRSDPLRVKTKRS